MPRIWKLFNLQKRPIFILDERSLQYSEELFKDILLTQQLLTVTIANGNHIQRIASMLIIFLIGEEENHILKQIGQGPVVQIYMYMYLKLDFLISTNVN